MGKRTHPGALYSDGVTTARLTRSLAPVTAVLIALAAIIGASSVGASSSMTANQASIDSATLDAVVPAPADAPTGVSPEVFYDDATATYYLLTTSAPAKQYSSTDGVTWTATTTELPMGIDWSIVKEGPSSYRLYYAEMLPSTGGPAKPCTPKTKFLRYATSSDLRTWTPQPGVLLDDVGCGVPHVMKTSAGDYFLYFNKVDVKHGIFISTSSDGLDWSTPVGPLNGNEDLVDPAPLELPDGTFVMVASTTGGQGTYQQLQLLASDDAVTWVQRDSTLLASSTGGVFDPSIELVDGQLHVWFGYSPAGSHDAARITHGLLTLGSGEPTPELQVTCAKVKSAKKPTISCTGSSSAVDPGTALVPHVRIDKNAWKAITTGQPKVAAKGTFTWRYSTKKATSISVYFTDGDTSSNRVTVAMR